MWTKLEAEEQLDLITVPSSQRGHLANRISLGTWLLEGQRELKTDDHVPGLYGAAKEIQSAPTLGWQSG